MNLLTVRFGCSRMAEQRSAVCIVHCRPWWEREAALHRLRMVVGAKTISGKRTLFFKWEIDFPFASIQ